ncbi:hypothetical protein RRG08_047112 [Elysia crispata]|uniref:Uncharacterized protein n=1 Tax=Elysia crispata TaxID=231223 RepID=A0AAE1E1S7_9GAST|nr:hypothetical protein RRG08_047112 [Elysia crispata]
MSKNRDCPISWPRIVHVVEGTREDQGDWIGNLHLHGGFPGGQSSSSPVRSPRQKPPSEAPVRSSRQKPPSEAPVRSPRQKPPSEAPVRSPRQKLPSEAPVRSPRETWRK